MIKEGMTSVSKRREDAFALQSFAKQNKLLGIYAQNALECDASSHRFFSRFDGPALCCLRGLHVFRVFAEACLAVAHGAVMECLLRSSYIRRVTLPGFEHRSLQCPAVGEAQLPGEIRKLIHRVEMLGGLAAGTACFMQRTVASATSSTEACC